MSKKTLIYGSFILTSLVTITLFVTSRTYIQLVAASFLYLLVAYFALRLFPRKGRIRGIPHNKPTYTAQPSYASGGSENADVVDINKRDFLKMAWTAGLSFFIFSIFTKRAETLFFGKAAAGSGITALEDTTGNKINPAREQPTDGYQISDIDYGNITFYGYTKKNGNWFITKEDTEVGSFRYTKGGSDFPSNWANREHLKYDYFHNVFS